MAFPDDPCDACPRVARGLSLPCKAQVTKHARYCVLVAEGRADYVAELCDEPPEDFPPLAQQAANLAGAVGRFVASGLKQSTPEQVSSRLGICRGCSHFRDGRCALCGCHLMVKVRADPEHCPIGKW